MSRVRSALAALRGFARGFIGLVTPVPRDASTARAQLEEAATRRPRCC